eukprot:908463-Rhodomonas_salina.1
MEGSRDGREQSLTGLHKGQPGDRNETMAGGSGSMPVVISDSAAPSEGGAKRRSVSERVDAFRASGFAAALFEPVFQVVPVRRISHQVVVVLSLR